MDILVIKQFRDKYTGEVYKPGCVITVSPERGEEILTNLQPGYAEAQKVLVPVEDENIEATGKNTASNGDNLATSDSDNPATAKKISPGSLMGAGKRKKPSSISNE